MRKKGKVRKDNIQRAKVAKVGALLRKLRCDNFKFIGYGRIRFTFKGRPSSTFSAAAKAAAEAQFLRLTKDMEKR